MPKLEWNEDDYKNDHLIALLEEEEDEDEYEDDGDETLDLDDPEEATDDEEETTDTDEEEHTDDEESDEPDEVDDRRPAKPSRGQARIRQLANERKQEREENIRLRAQLDALSAQARVQPQERPDPAAEAAFLAALSPEERIRHEVGQVLQRQNAALQMTQFNMQDMLDKQAYDSAAAINPVHKKYAGEVERRLSDLRTNHRMNVPRAEILKNIIGEQVLAGNGKKVVSREKAKQNVKNNTTKSSSGRSDLSRNKAGSLSEKEKRYRRLENQTF